MARDRVGPIYMYGPIGSGKTSILRRLTERLSTDPRYTVAYVISPNVRRPNTFLKIIMDAFDVPSVRSYDANLKLFETFLVDQYQANKVVDTRGIDAALGRHGTADGEIYKFSIARREQIEASDHVLTPPMGITTGINFPPLGHNRAAINGDFVLRAEEIQKVIQALRKGNIDIVELHNHTLDEQPRLFYMHFWAIGDGLALAKGLRPALDATNLQPAS